MGRKSPRINYKVFLISFAPWLLSGWNSETGHTTLYRKSSTERGIKSVLASLGGSACPDAPEFVCVTLNMPVDHYRPDERTLNFRIAVRPATGKSRGAWLIAEGGPGAAGILAASGYLHFAPWLGQEYDVIAYDLRGTGGSSRVECPKAKSEYERLGRYIGTHDDAQSLLRRTRVFAQDCPAEAGFAPSNLPFYNTEQAVEDIESARIALGLETLTIYGKSYGTQIAQIYARAHPDHTRALILDGVVDMTLTHLEYNESVTGATNRVLERVLADCSSRSECAADFRADAKDAFDRVAAQLQSEPAEYDFILPSGVPQRRAFTRAQLDMATIDSLQAGHSRMMFLRALAAAERSGDFAPLGRLAYTTALLDPATFTFDEGQDSQATYHAFVCNDCGRSGATSDEAAWKWIAAGQELIANGTRLVSGLFLDLVCSYWPSAIDTSTSMGTSPPNESDGTVRSIPTLILAAEADPLTPVEQAMAVFDRLPDAVAVRVAGGQHVLWGRGSSCVDEAVRAFAIDAVVPTKRVSQCEMPLVKWYKSLVPLSAGDLRDDAQRIASVEREVLFLPEYNLWDHQGRLTLGCGVAGSVTFEDTGDGTGVTFAGCSFTQGVVVSGGGLLTAHGEQFEGTVYLGAGVSSLRYSRSGDRVSTSSQ